MGAFILAKTGLLDQQQSTTTWSLAPFFRRRFPQVQLDESGMVVPCSIGVTAGSSRPSLPRLATRMAPHCEPSCATASDAVFEKSALILNKSMRRAGVNDYVRNQRWGVRHHCRTFLIREARISPHKSASVYECCWDPLGRIKPATRITAQL
jgi:hypothetical protein